MTESGSRKVLFDRAVETYRLLRGVQKRFPNFNLNVAVTISHFNQDKLLELYGFLKNELQVENINHLLCRGEPRVPEALEVDTRKYQEFSELLDADLRRNILKGYHGYPFADLVNAMKIVRQKIIRKIHEQDRYVAPCYAAQLGVILYPDGDVAPCELREEIIGNVRDADYNFRDIMYSGRAEEMRSRIRKEKCHCTYECFLTNAVISIRSC